MRPSSLQTPSTLLEPPILPIHPLDYPALWKKPSAESLLALLRSLQVPPRQWRRKRPPKQLDYDRAACNETASLNAQDRELRRQHRQLTAAYLTQLVSSGLSWLATDADREAVWEEASRRLAERCGRSAAGEMTRQWRFDCDDDKEAGNSGVSNNDTCKTNDAGFVLRIREPPLTGDNLGFKTWGASWLLANMLPDIRHRFLSHLLNPPLSLNASSSSSSSLSSSAADRKSTVKVVNVLELGAGTGLLGLAASVLLAPLSASAATNTLITVTLTDLPVIAANLAHNLALNADVVRLHTSGNVFVDSRPLTWGKDVISPPQPPLPSWLLSTKTSTSGGVEDNAFRRAADSITTSEIGSGDVGRVDEDLRRYFDLILVADPLYSAEHPALLASCIDAHLPPLLSSSSSSSSSLVSSHLLPCHGPREVLSSAAACVVVAVPLRDTVTTALRDDFVRHMAKRGLGCLGEGMEEGQDDWGDDVDDGKEEATEEGDVGGCNGSGVENGRKNLLPGTVMCWWGLFARKAATCFANE